MSIIYHSGNLEIGGYDGNSNSDIFFGHSQSGYNTLTAKSFTKSSDSTLKKEIRLIDNPLGTLRQINGYSYYNNNCYHCNFGWGGSGDGWYYLTCVDPLSHNFSYNQCAFTNIYPTTYTNVDFINSTMSTGTFTGHKIIIENSSVNSGANIILDANCSTEIFGPFTVPAGSCLEIR